MGNNWSIHLPDFLADNGTIAAYSPRGHRLAKYWTEMWFCPACDDNGRISGWEGTFWDNSDAGEASS
jgi:hypothetical protein